MIDKIQEIIDKGGLAYRLPGEKHFVAGKIKKTELFNFSMLNSLPDENIFLVAPFDARQENAWWFNFVEEKFPCCPSTKKTTIKDYKQINSSSTDFNSYSSQFYKMMEHLKSGKLKKIILSRTITKNKNLLPILAQVFFDLCNKHPQAFVYLINSPNTGIWTGVSPETILKKTGDSISTVSLAGTRNKLDSDIKSWSFKELEEQEMVSNYIDDVLKNYNIANYQKEGPEVIKAGNVNHLVTSYSFPFKSIKDSLGEFVFDLYPTPALCGEPKLQALNLISEIEPHRRSYYGGFLGPVNKNNIDLFVNIRCMKVNNKHSTIFVGGGLTLQSDLQNEWDETVLKSKTLLSVIRDKL